MNEPRCYSRFDYEEKMLEKMVRSEIKNEELLAKLEVLEKRLTNVETEVDNSVMEIKELEKKHDTEQEEQKKSLDVYDQRLDAISRNITESVHQPPVAFFATLSSGFTTSTSSQTIVFNNFVTDIGGGYNPGTGVFTAPVDGLYVFSTSFMVDLSTSKTSANFRIKKNGNIITYLIVNDSDGDYETVSGTVILSLQVGDNVMVTCNDIGRSIIGLYTFLSGFKLYSA
ncbi:complement C1q-like protein 4 isoform X2 [Mya arenaria]|nr:complement C1q-like protein 4 isoform X2 [Mya arenaria]